MFHRSMQGNAHKEGREVQHLFLVVCVRCCERVFGRACSVYITLEFCRLYPGQLADWQLGGGAVYA